MKRLGKIMNNFLKIMSIFAKKIVTVQVVRFLGRK